MSLDDVTDPIASAVATLIKGSVNAKLHPILGEDPIVKVFGAPLPVVSIPHQDLPAITLWRFQDAGQALDDYSFESRTTFRLDYYAAATPIERIQTRWALLTKVWECAVGAVRVGCDPSVQGGATIVRNAGAGAFFNGSERVRYAFVPGAGVVYPGFQGQFDIVTDYSQPDGIAAFDTLDPFEEIKTDWQLKPEENLELEATDIIELEQP